MTASGEWEAWILFLLEGLRATSLSTVQKIDATFELQELTQNQIRTFTTAGANADLLAVLFEQPYCRIANVMLRCHVSRPTATGWLNALVSAGVLTDVKVGRERLFVNAPFFDILVREERSAASVEPTLL